MDQNEARRRVLQGGTFLCLDVPQGIEFGCNCRVWTVGPSFKGIKMLPPGVHLFVWSAGHGMRYGCFHSLSPSQVVVNKWDDAIEDFGAGVKPGTAEHGALAAAVHRFEFDRGLAAYDEADTRRWVGLSNYITTTVLKRANVGGGARITPADPDAKAVGPDSQAVVPHFDHEARTLRFVVLDVRPKGIHGAELTQFQLDGTSRLEMLLELSYDRRWELLLGELQVAFVAFLMLSAHDGLEQWKRLVALLCSCTTAFGASAHESMLLAFVEILYRQLEHVPTDFFRDELSQDNFLRSALSELFSLPPDTVAAAELSRRLAKLRKFVTSHFSVHIADLAPLEDENDDAPVVVEDCASATGLADGVLAVELGGCGKVEPAERMAWMLEPDGLD